MLENRKHRVTELNVTSKDNMNLNSDQQYNRDEQPAARPPNPAREPFLFAP